MCLRPLGLTVATIACTLKKSTIMSRPWTACLAVAAGMALAARTAPAEPAGSAFTYQAQLKKDGAAFTGTIDFSASLFDAPTGGNLVAGPVDLTGVGVLDGLFTVQLDFGTDPFNGDARFLEIAVRAQGDPAFTLLAPRQELTPTPYAIRALIDETFALPFEATIDRPEDAFSITNLGGNVLVGTSDAQNAIAVKGLHTGIGQAGFFQTTDTTNTLPALEGVSNAPATAFRAANLGAGGAALIEITNAGNPQTALTARTAGPGGAAFLSVTNPTSLDPALDVLTIGLAEAGFFEIQNPVSNATALVGSTDGLGIAGAFGITNPANEAPALAAQTFGLGSAADFRTGTGGLPGLTPTATVSALNFRNSDSAGVMGNFSTENSDPAVAVATFGRGPAGVFIIANSDQGTTSGNGETALIAQTNGLGRAGFFEIDVGVGPFAPAEADPPLSHTNNTAPALEARTNADGPAGLFLITDPESPTGTAALQASTDGQGEAGYFEVLAPDNEAAALRSLTLSTGNGQAASFTTSSPNNSGTTMEAVHFGLGRAGNFELQEPTNASTALTATTFGTGSAASFSVEREDQTENPNNAPALRARTLALGPAARFEIDRAATGTGTDPVNNSPAIHVTTNASGQVARLESTSTEPVNPALEVTAEGRGIVGRFATNNASSGEPTIVAQTQGTGPVAQLTNFNSSNTSPVLEVSTNATGNVRAALFQNTSLAGASDLVACIANNQRHALFAQQTGPGEAAHFEIADPGNFNNAVFIKNNGPGIALSVENQNPNFAALALAVRGKSAFNGQVDILSSTGGGVPVNITGDVGIAGNLTVSGGQICGPVCGPVKQFKIDHPLDPDNKYLQHASIESHEMKNLYDGTVTLDDRGEATVELPEWFEALNTGFRYHLTAIGAPAPNLHVARKIQDNRFSIAGGTPGLEVSWQVTGIRQDRYAREHPLEVEVPKPKAERAARIEDPLPQKRIEREPLPVALADPQPAN